MTDFISTLFSNWQNWDAGQWSLVVAIIALGITGIEKFFGGFSKLLGVLRPRKPEPVPFYTVEDPSKPDPKPQHAFPKITPPARERALVGRKDEMEKLRSILASRQGVEIVASKGAVLKAEGGRGKTTLAREYAEVFGPGYDGGAWLDAREQMTLLTDLAVLGHAAFDMPVPEPVTMAHGKAVIARIHNSGARWLLVYDNIDDFTEVKALVAHGDNIDVIITTRLAPGWDGFGKIDLGVLGFADASGGAVDLLLQEARMQRAPPAERDVARDVAEQLGGLPLALVMAGTLVREDGITLTTLRDEVAQVLTRVPEGQDYDDSVAGAVLLSYGRLSDGAQALVDCCAWLAPVGIDPQMFTQAVESPKWAEYRDNVPGNLLAVIEDATALNAAFVAARRWSVLTGKGLFEMHRLAQAVLRAEQEVQGRGFACAKGAAAVLATIYPKPPSVVKNWPHCRALTPHVQALWLAAGDNWNGPWGQPGWADMGYVLNQTAIFLSRQEDHTGSIALYRASLQLVESRLGEEHRVIPNGLGNLAHQLAEVGEFNEAQELITRAVALDEAHRSGTGRSKLAERYFQQANIALRVMEAREGAARFEAEAVAEAALDEADALYTELFGAQSARMALVWNQRGYLRNLQERNEDAWRAYGQALDIIRALPDVDTRELALLAMNVGATAVETGRAEAAEAPLREAYVFAVKEFGDIPQHGFFVQSTLCLIGCLLVLARKGDDPERRRAEAREICALRGLVYDDRVRDAEKYPLDPLDGFDAVG
ncbi:tetratricopeptide repeat protein [Puniceibacterium sediminis]|uniref:NB-ARC domain-containing protein n=1 Tax=Puniceibacterium sediminis TaxID=1608407 RepID=A0A238XAD2_9RHOB|nr:tetratricopeptide repeat protein [Puniceibacterium sediminis]SNR55996.1 NB-ARC domain-containing protein [Puniceibacterium sediminis]